MVLNINLCQSEQPWSLTQEERKLKAKSRGSTEGTWHVYPEAGRAWVCGHEYLIDFHVD